jgi:DNA-binding transcriptional MerR regulator
MNNIKNVLASRILKIFQVSKRTPFRIWEKRYNVLEPTRTDTNIRLYDLESLQKLLNITLLHNHGYKISKISKYPNEKIPQLVREIISEKSAKNHAISAFKMAMINFDQAQFLATYDDLLSEKSFREVFFEVFIPLISEVGLLWQSDTITPAHEHFISSLINKKY